jgi:DNA modification methylase
VRPYLIQRLDELLEQRPPDDQELVTFTESLATEFVEELSRPGDLVLDPFAGFGTTLVVAERLGRRGFGIELMPERVEQVRRRIGVGATVVLGDARDVGTLVTEPVALCLTSPPYLTTNDHPEDPLQAYEVEAGDYAGYLASLADVFDQVAQVLAPGGHAVVNVANTTQDGVFTPLAWDVARALSAHLDLLGETYVAWDTLLPGIASDHCLVFRRPE